MKFEEDNLQAALEYAQSVTKTMMELQDAALAALIIRAGGTVTVSGSELDAGSAVEIVADGCGGSETEDGRITLRTVPKG